MTSRSDLPLFRDTSRVQSTGWMVCPKCRLRQLALSPDQAPSIECGICGTPMVAAEERSA